MRDWRRRFEAAYADWVFGTEHHNYEIRMGMAEGLEYPVNRARFVYEWLLDVPVNGWKRAVCSRYGHRFVDAGSYATPDTGADCLECVRCGFGFTHVYY